MFNWRVTAAGMRDQLRLKTGVWVNLVNQPLGFWEKEGLGFLGRREVRVIRLVPTC